MKICVWLMIILVGPACFAADVLDYDADYSYDPGLRRDPFVPHVGSQNGIPPGAITAANIVVVGIVETPEGYAALVQSPDRKTITLHAGDSIYDATVITVDAEELVMRQDVQKIDPASVIRYREVRKRLHPVKD